MSNESFQTLYKKHQTDFFRFARRLTSSHFDAEDLVQDAVAKAYVNRLKLKDISRFKSWINTILYNTHLSNYRKTKRRSHLLNEAGESASFFFNISTCYNEGLETVKEEDIRDMIRLLNPDKASTFDLYVRGYGYREIAEELDISIGTVKSRIHATRARLRRLCMHHGVLKTDVRLN